MELSTEQLTEIESFSYRYLEKSEIALVLALDDPTILDDQEHPAYMAFWKGRLKRKAEFNHSVITLSNQLSSPAQAIELKMAERVTINDKKKL